MGENDFIKVKEDLVKVEKKRWTDYIYLKIYLKKTTLFIIVFSLLFSYEITESNWLISKVTMGLRVSTDTLQMAIFNEINFVRTKPQEYANFIENYKDESCHEKVNDTDIVEAVKFLKEVAPVDTLEFSETMSLACLRHLQDLAPKGLSGHKGSDGTKHRERLELLGKIGKNTGENISYYEKTARCIVSHLVIDAGVESKIHRRNLLNPNYKFVGIASGEHTRYERMSVMVFADEFIKKVEN